MQLGTSWARGNWDEHKSLIEQAKSSATSCIDIAGVASSILATPTIFSPFNIAPALPRARNASGCGTRRCA